MRLRDRGHPRDVAAEPEDGEIDDRADSEVPQPIEAGDRGLDHGRLVPLGMGEVQVQLGLPTKTCSWMSVVPRSSAPIGPLKV